MEIEYNLGANDVVLGRSVRVKKESFLSLWAIVWCLVAYIVELDCLISFVYLVCIARIALTSKVPRFLYL